MRGGVSGLGAATPGKEPARIRVPEPEAPALVAHQTKLSSLVNSGMDLTARAVVRGDGCLHVSVAPVFQSAASGGCFPTVANPLIPGGGNTAGIR